MSLTRIHRRPTPASLAVVLCVATTLAPHRAQATGQDKSGVTAQSISVPKGPGTIQGMGESFSAQASTGIATFGVPISLPTARGDAQPSLGLSYSSGAGNGVVGVGWSIGVAFIARQTDLFSPKKSSPVVAALDVNGDATIDLIHMPQESSYAIFTPSGSGRTQRSGSRCFVGIPSHRR